MAIESSIKNLILLVLAIIIVVALWRAVWFLAGLAIFVAVVYFVTCCSRATSNSSVLMAKQDPLPTIR